jgi:putative ABC transport system permease protein
MKRLRVFFLRVLNLFASRQNDTDINDELDTLLQLHVDDNLRAGMTPEDARRHALIRFGGVQSVKDAYRDQRGLPLLETTLQDARFGIRVLFRHRSYSVVAVLTLALGIGTTTTMFSIVDAVMLRPFPFPATDRLVVIWEVNAGRGIDTFTGSLANYVDWRRSATTFSHLGAWQLLRDNRTDGVLPRQVQGAVASAPFFRALGIAPHRGRFLRDDEDTPAGRFVVVLGYEYWQREFAASDSAIGQSVVINGDAHTILGVMPPLGPPFRADIWRPLAADVAALDRGDHSVFVVGRLAPGQTIESAEAELQSVAAGLAETFVESNRGWSVRAEPLYQAFVPDRTRRAMLTLLVAVGLLLLIACVNVASLTLSRATSRVRELSTRFALGAGRLRLVRQLFTESVLLAIVSALLGLLAAAWLLQFVQWIYPTETPGVAEAQLNRYAVAFAAVMSGLTTIVFGLVPAYQVARQFSQVRHLTTRAATSAPRIRTLRHTFAAAQVALALVLLVGSGLLLASVDRLLSVPLGFGPDQVMTGRVSLNDRRYEDVAQYVGFVTRVLSDLRTKPGVAAAGITSSVPFDGAYTAMQVRHERDRDTPSAEGFLAQWRVIGGDYLPAMRIPMLAGRPFTDLDTDDVPRVTIISQSLAERLFGAENPLERHILVGDARRPYRVVGVAGAARLTALEKQPEPTMYFHYHQFGWPPSTVVVRAVGNADTLEGFIRSAVTSADASQPVFDEQRLVAIVAAAAAAPRMNAALLSMFGVLALILAATGVYGTMSYAATQRTDEMSLRLALGARPASVFLLMIRSGVLITVTGVVIGVIVAAAAAASLSDLLFGVSALDAQVYTTAAVFVLAVAAAACCIPARRAMRADPVTVLRQE